MRHYWLSSRRGSFHIPTSTRRPGSVYVSYTGPRGRSPRGPSDWHPPEVQSRRQAFSLPCHDGLRGQGSLNTQKSSKFVIACHERLNLWSRVSLCGHKAGPWLPVRVNCTYPRLPTYYTDKKPCKLGKKAAVSLRRSSRPCRCPRGSPRPSRDVRYCLHGTLEVCDRLQGLFWCPRRVLDVHGSLHSLFWRPTVFFDGRLPFLMAAIVNFRFK